MKDSSRILSPSLWLAIYDPTLTLPEALERNYARPILVNANGMVAVNLETKLVKMPIGARCVRRTELIGMGRGWKLRDVSPSSWMLFEMRAAAAAAAAAATESNTHILYTSQDTTDYASSVPDGLRHAGLLQLHFYALPKHYFCLCRETG